MYPLCRDRASSGGRQFPSFVNCRWQLAPFPWSGIKAGSKRIAARCNHVYQTAICQQKSARPQKFEGQKCVYCVLFLLGTKLHGYKLKACTHNAAQG